jgi:hypothetical protein
MPAWLVARGNKDIEFKLLSETFKERSFEAYGLDLPRNKAVLPTHLPEITANEKHLDNLFQLEDDTIAIVDYESEDKLYNRVKYVNYIARIMERYYRDEGRIPNLRMIVIYTGDVGSAKASLEMGCFTLRMEQVFVSHLQGEEIYQKIKRKVENQEQLTEQELMRLIILPLAEKGKGNKQRRVEEVVELAKMMEDARMQAFVITGVLVCSDKFVDREYAESIRRYLSMTKVFQILEEEKREAIAQAGEEATKRANRLTAIRMLRKAEDIEKIVEYSGLTEAEIEEVSKEMLVEMNNAG